MSRPKQVLARSMTIRHTDGRIDIDGVTLPFFTHADGPSVEPATRDMPITTVWLGILVDGVVTLEGDGKRAVYDPELGDVGEWARAMVRAEYTETFPWLALPEAA